MVACVVLALLTSRAAAIQNLATGVYKTTAPTSADIPNWDGGWPGSSTGWSYVGMVNGAGGVYLGNGWVLTVAHVGAGPLVLDGITYAMVPGSTRGFTTGSNTADITLFQIASPPNLPALTIASSAPTSLSPSRNGSAVAMIGPGGGAKSWGLNTVTMTNAVIQVSTFTTTDFKTTYGTTIYGSRSATNNYAVVIGDSGGGDFIYNSNTGKWELAGLNEATDVNNSSYFVELSAYASQLNPIIAVPMVTTLAATSITENGATLNGTVNAQNYSTAVSFDYGPTTSYGTNAAGTPSPVTGTTTTAVTRTLTGLAPGTTYHFRVNGVNSAGTSNGGDLSFTTLPSALQSWRQTYYGTMSNSGNAADSADPHGTGIQNLAVFAFLGPNQDPATARISQLPQLQLSGGNLFYSFTQPSGVSGVTYGAQWSSTLLPTDWHAIPDTGSGNQHLFSVSADIPRRFIRLTVSDP